MPFVLIGSRRLAIVLAVGALVSTSTTSLVIPGGAGTVTPATTDSGAIVARTVAALEARNPATIADLLAPDVELSLPFTFSGDHRPEGVPRYQGRDAVLGYLGQIVSGFSQVRFVDPRYTVSGDGNTVFFEASGDFTVAGSGLPYRNAYVIRYDLAGGQIVAVREYANPVTFAVTFGATLGTPPPRHPDGRRSPVTRPVQLSGGSHWSGILRP